MNIWKLVEYPNITKIIDSYLEPIHINNFRHKNENEFTYLIKNNIPLKYAIDYARYPPKTLYFIIELSKLMSVDDAYDILMNIPSKQYKINNINVENPLEEHIVIVNKLEKLLCYNYFWGKLFIKLNVDITMIKYLLHTFIDFYFLELFHYNKINNNYNISLNIVIMSIKDTLEYKNIYYKLRNARVPHLIAYKMSRLDGIHVNKIIDIAKAGFYNVDNLVSAVPFNDIQIDFLKLSKCCYTDEEFSIHKQKIFNNAVSNQLIDVDDFIPCAKKLCV
jgi:hypothetical protein